MYLNGSTNEFPLLLIEVSFHMVLSFQRHQDSNFRFQTNEKKGSSFKIELTEDQSNMFAVGAQA